MDATADVSAVASFVLVIGLVAARARFLGRRPLGPLVGERRVGDVADVAALPRYAVDVRAATTGGSEGDVGSTAIPSGCAVRTIEGGQLILLLGGQIVGEHIRVATGGIDLVSDAIAIG